MLYRHTLRFQIILQQGLHFHIREDRISETQIRKSSKIECSKSTLNRFRNADLGSLSDDDPKTIDKPIPANSGVYLNPAFAESLWTYLQSKLVFERMIDAGDMSVLGVYSRETVGDAIQGFYGVKSSESQSFATAGLSGPFFCYKPSFRRRGFTVKSTMKFKDTGHGFFLVDEKQITTGVFEMDLSPIVEKSTGFGFIKSGRLWIFMRDIESEQPRIFCFHKPKYSNNNGSNNAKLETLSPSNQTVYSWFGYLIEGVKGNQDNAFNFRVVLNAESNERKRWTKNTGKNPSFYKPNDQLDVLPTSKKQIKHYKAELDNKKREGKEIYVPVEVMQYFKSGDISDISEI